MGAADLARARLRFDRQENAAARPRGQSDAGLQAKLDPLGLEEALEREDDVLVLALQDLRGLVDDRDEAPHAAVELAHLESDVAGSDEDEMARHLVVVEPVAGVDVRDLP